MDPVEIRKISGSTVACDGGAMGHPRVFLNLGDDGVVDCPYCGCRFVHDAGAAKAGAGDAGAGAAEAH